MLNERYALLDFFKISQTQINEFRILQTNRFKSSRQRINQRDQNFDCANFYLLYSQRKFSKEVSFLEFPNLNKQIIFERQLLRCSNGKIKTQSSNLRARLIEILKDEVGLNSDNEFSRENSKFKNVEKTYKFARGL